MQFAMVLGVAYPRYQRIFSHAVRHMFGRRTPLARRGAFLPSPLTFELFYRITFTPIRLKVSDCDHVGRHVKKCPKTHIILRKTSSIEFEIHCFKSNHDWVTSV